VNRTTAWLFVNSSKTFLIVKEVHLAQACSTFSDTGIQITTKGRRYLGSAVGSPGFVKSYVSEEWTNEISKLCEFADTQPHAAFSALTHGLFRRWIYLFRVLPNINELLSPLEQCIHMQLLPTLTGKCVFSDLERQLLSLPSRLGGVGILNPAASCTAQFDSLLKVASPLVSLLMEQTAEFTVIAINKQHALKQEVHLNNRHRCEEMAATLHPLLSLDL